MDFTVLVSTSPIKSHPDTRIIDQTIQSIRERTDAPIIVMCDGVRHEQQEYAQRYSEYLTRLQKKYPDLGFVYSEEHKHQARLTRDSLQYVHTPLLFFVEHDMPLCEEVPFKEMSDMIFSGQANMVRLMFEAHILDVHKHLMLERVGDYTKTIQYSQRPHMASTAFYNFILNEYFSPESKTFIEDRMHGVVSEAPWEVFKVWIYTPDGDNKRSYTIDGREDDSKYDDQLIF